MFDKKYKDKEIEKILKSIIILVDNREKVWSHIKLWLKTNKINFEQQTLNFGDYSFKVPKNEELGIQQDILFTDYITIERKGSLDELVGNFASDRDRLEREFERHKGKMHLVIEESQYRDIWEGNYKSEYANKSAIATLHSFTDRYNLNTIFIDKEYSAKYIYYTFYYYLRNKLKQ